jgi:hypothetical protein
MPRNPPLAHTRRWKIVGVPPAQLVGWRARNSLRHVSAVYRDFARYEIGINQGLKPFCTKSLKVYALSTRGVRTWN